MLADVLNRNWGWIGVRGVVALLFGMLTLYNPMISLTTLVFLVGSYALVDGTFMIVGSFANRRGEQGRVALLIGGLIGLGVAAVAYGSTGITTATLLELIAAWAILTGIAEITAAIRLRKEITREWTIALAGAFAVAFGVALIALPVRGALAMVLWVGAYAVAAGVLLIGLAVQLRGWDQDHPGMAMSEAG